jgi:hypothetical protein
MTPMHRCSEPSCSFFNQVLPHNARVCPMCGTSLEQAISAPADMGTATGVAQPLISPLISSKSNGQIRPQLKLIHASGHSFLLIRESGVIGRQNQTNGTRPEIDLTSLPHSKIISRSHAFLYWDLEQQTYLIVDDSLNGSYLNDALLHRGSPHPLQQGDKLQLGQDKLICLQVELSLQQAWIDSKTA